MIPYRAPLGDLNRRFNIGWFLGAIQKYRRLGIGLSSPPSSRLRWRAA